MLLDVQEQVSLEFPVSCVLARFGTSVLIRTRIPIVKQSEVLLLTWCGYGLEPKYNMVEFFSGHAQVSQAFRDGLSVASYDIEYDKKSMDFLAEGG